MVAIAMVLRLNTIIPVVTLPAATMIGREIIISALREWMAELGNAAAWRSPGSKAKTTAQMVWMLWRPNAWLSGGNWSAVGSGSADVVVMLQYLNAARGDLLDQRSPP